MSLILVGTNYRFSPVQLREWLTVNQKREEHWLEYFSNKFRDIEVVVLNTCNRFEIYIWRTNRIKPDVQDILLSLASQSEFSLEQFQQNFYCYRTSQAAKHLLRVACSMDSMLIGEHQIAGQVRSAFLLAQKKQTIGTYLSRLFQTALKLAKRLRNEADISTGHFSLGSVAVDFITKTSGQLHDKNILIIGAGKMGKNTLAHLISKGTQSVTLINRDIKRAREIANMFSPVVSIGNWKNLSDELTNADIVISCLAVDKPIITRKDVEHLSTSRADKPILIIDLGLPRNIDARISRLPWIRLYDLSALESTLREQNKKRRDELAKYEYLIDQYLDEYMHWLNQQTVTPVIAALHNKFHSLAESELSWLNGKLSENISQRDRQMIEQMTYRLIQKILHEPITVINEQTKNQRGGIYAGIVKKLFKLYDENTNNP